MIYQPPRLYIQSVDLITNPSITLSSGRRRKNPKAGVACGMKNLKTIIITREADDERFQRMVPRPRRLHDLRQLLPPTGHLLPTSSGTGERMAGSMSIYQRVREKETKQPTRVLVTLRFTFIEIIIVTALFLIFQISVGHRLAYLSSCG